MAGNHVTSSHEVRVQVIEVGPHPGGLFEVGIGKLLIVALLNPCVLETDEDEVTLSEGDQALLSASDRFRLKRPDPAVASNVELVWLPGPEAS